MKSRWTGHGMGTVGQSWHGQTQHGRVSMAQPPVWCVHSGEEVMGTASRAPCVETPLDLNFPPTQWKSVMTHKKHRANRAGWLWKLHTQLCRPGASSLQTKSPHNTTPPHSHLSAPCSYCTFSPSQISILTSSPSLPFHPSTQNLSFQTSQCLSSLSTLAHGLSNKNSEDKNISLTFPGFLLKSFFSWAIFDCKSSNTESSWILINKTNVDVFRSLLTTTTTTKNKKLRKSNAF